MVKNPPANAGDIREVFDLLEDDGMAIQSGILA